MIEAPASLRCSNYLSGTSLPIGEIAVSTESAAPPTAAPLTHRRGWPGSPPNDEAPGLETVPPSAAEQALTLLASASAPGPATRMGQGLVGVLALLTTALSAVGATNSDAAHAAAHTAAQTGARFALVGAVVTGMTLMIGRYAQSVAKIKAAAVVHQSATTQPAGLVEAVGDSERAAGFRSPLVVVCSCQCHCRTTAVGAPGDGHEGA